MLQSIILLNQNLRLNTSMILNMYLYDKWVDIYGDSIKNVII